MLHNSLPPPQACKALHPNDLFGLWFRVLQRKIEVVVSGFLNFKEYGFCLASIFIWVMGYLIRVIYQFC